MSTELEDIKDPEDQRALSAKRAIRKGFITRAENYILSDLKSVPLLAVKAPDLIRWRKNLAYHVHIFVLALQDKISELAIKEGVEDGKVNLPVKCFCINTMQMCSISMMRKLQW